MATSKTDKTQIDFNLDTIDIPEAARPYRFPFKGQNFETVDLAELDFADMEKALDTYYRTNSPRAVIDMLLAGQAEKFWACKPSIWHVNHLGNELVPIMQGLVGEPGESNGSAQQ